jgi:WD40 repeat protein
MDPCPARESLEQLLARRLSPPEQTAVEEYVEDCPRCQGTLEDLLGDGPGESLDSRLLRHDALRQRFQPGADLPPAAETDRSAEDRGPTTVITPRPDPGPGGGEGPELMAGYEVLGELGRGGMGVVYRARQVKLNRLVALKMILAAGHAGEEERQRFRTEAEAIARLQHPHIVQVYEVGEADGRPFCSLEFCAGGSLAGKLAEGTLPAREAAALLHRLAGAVQSAHEAGVVHRDLKPANVLMTADGTPKVTDFGLAKRLGEAGQTLSGAVMGTPCYMAPEQAAGRGKQVGPAADVYALGAVLYECLTGRPPFRGESVMDTLEQVLTREPVPVRQLQPKVPRDLETICLKCLQKEPPKRYGSARDLAEDLERFPEGRPVLARPTSGPERLLKWARRRPAAALAALLLALVVVLVATGLPALAVLWLRAEERRVKAEQETLRAQTAEMDAGRAQKYAEGERDRAQNHLYIAHVNLAQQYWEQNALASMVHLLQEHDPGKLGVKDPPGFEYYYLWRLAHPDRTLGTAEEAGSTLAFSRDGRLLAADGGQSGLVTVWDTATGAKALSWKAAAEPVVSVAFSPDGKRLVTVTEGILKKGRVTVWDLAGPKELLSFEGPGSETGIRPGGSPWVSRAVLSPDGKHVASAGDGGRVRVRDAATGKEVFTVPGYTAAYSPDGKHLVSSRMPIDGALLTVWDAATGKEVRPLGPARPGVLASEAAFSPDGKFVATFLPNLGSPATWDVATGKEVLAARKQEAVQIEFIGTVAFSPDGQRLAAPAADGTLAVWDLSRGDVAFALKGHRNAQHLWPAFSPDGRLLASTDGTEVRLWLPTGQGPLTVPAGTGPGNFGGRLYRQVYKKDWKFFHFSKDGRYLATPYRVWDTVTGQLVQATRGGRVALSPDGR